MDKIFPSASLMYDPSPEEVLYDTFSVTGADMRLSHLLSSPSNEILSLAVKLYEKIPWGSKSDEDAVGTLLRRLMFPNCPVFATATCALGLIFDKWMPRPGWRPGHAIVESGILRSDAFKRILSLSSSSSQFIQHKVASFLSEVGYSLENADDVNACIDAGLAQAILMLLTSHHVDVRSNARSTIREFTTKGAEYCNAFCLQRSSLPSPHNIHL